MTRRGTGVARYTYVRLSLSQGNHEENTHEAAHLLVRAQYLPTRFLLEVSCLNSQMTFQVSHHQSVTLTLPLPRVVRALVSGKDTTI